MFSVCAERIRVIWHLTVIKTGHQAAWHSANEPLIQLLITWLSSLSHMMPTDTLHTFSKLPLDGSVAVSFCPLKLSHHFPKFFEMFHVDDSYFVDRMYFFNGRWGNLANYDCEGARTLKRSCEWWSIIFPPWKHYCITSSHMLLNWGSPAWAELLPGFQPVLCGSVWTCCLGYSRHLYPTHPWSPKTLF